MKPFPVSVEPLPPEVEDRLRWVVMDLTQRMREDGSIPDDWRIDVEIAPVTPADLGDNVVRVVATPRPPYNRFTGEGMD